MPIYEYECPKCGRFDVIEKMSAKPLATHDACGSRVRRLISASAFQFKGSGFYSTDYNGRNSAAITGKGEPATDSKADSKPEAKKPESKPEQKAAPKPAAGASSPAKKSA